MVKRIALVLLLSTLGIARGQGIGGGPINGGGGGGITTPVSIANGGTGTGAKPATNGVMRYDGTNITNDANFLYDGTHVGIGGAALTEGLDVNGGIATKGTCATNEANKTCLDQTSGTARLFGFGPNATTNGTLVLLTLRSDGTGVFSHLVTDPNTNSVGLECGSSFTYSPCAVKVGPSGAITTPQLVPSGSAPTLAPGAAAGTSPSCTTVAGTNQAGTLSCTTGTATASGALFTLTFNGTLASAFKGCRLFATNAAAAPTATALYQSAISATAATFSTTSALTASTAYTYNYECF